MKNNIYKQCDIRGVYGKDLLDFHAERLGAAVAYLKGKIQVVVGGDGRESTPVLKQKLIESLLDHGCDVIDLGMLPTPAFYFLLGHLGISAGIMVTASHNPAPDNGFKLILGPLPITPEEMRQLGMIMEDGSLQLPPAPRGKLEKRNLLTEYTRFARGEAPDLSGQHIVLDCGNGMASLTASKIFEVTGAKITLMYDTVDGRFPNHPANPAKESNLLDLKKAVLELGADWGAAFDGDADRVVFVDHLGRALSNDKAIVLFAQQALASQPGTIVYDQKCSKIVPEAVLAKGGTPLRERSGHTFIKTSFMKHNSPYAGEISGHHFFRNLGGDDGVIAALYMARYIQDTGKTLAELMDQVPSYPITPDIRLKMDHTTAEGVIGKLASGLAAEATISTHDGVRVEWDDGWGMARLSVTEPAITLRFEGNTLASLDRVMKRFEETALELSGKLSFD